MLTEQEFANIEGGTNGVEVIADTGAHTGPYALLLPIGTVIIASLKSEYLRGSLDGVTLPSGVPVAIPRITSITLTSGTLLAYRQ